VYIIGLVICGQKSSKYFFSVAKVKTAKLDTSFYLDTVYIFM